MLTEVNAHLKVMGLSLKYNIMKYMINKVSFITNIIFMMLNNSTFIIQWLILFNLREEIGNYSFTDVTLLWALSASIYGFSHILFERAYKLSDLIIDGKLDSFLVQPKNILISVLMSDTSISAIGDLLYGYVILCIFNFSITNIILFTIFTITGGLVITSVAVIFGSLSFWIVKSDYIAGTINNMMTNFSTYPEGIFKGLARIILYTLIPVGISTYLPMSVFMKFNVINILLVIIITIVMILFSFLVFNRGLKRYSSSNLMSAKM